LAKIEVTSEQERELKSRGFVVKPVTDEVSNRRHYWDPHKDEKGNVMGWTRPLPGDAVRMNFYMRQGFRLEDPDGNVAPPPGHFLRRTPPILTPREVREVGVGSGEVGQKQILGTAPVLQCPICQKDFPDTDTFVHHMIYHRSRKAKVKAKVNLKRARNKNNKKGGQ